MESLTSFEIDLNSYTEHELLHKVPIQYSSSKDYLDDIDERSDDKLIGKLKGASYDVNVYISKYIQHVKSIV